MTFFCVCVCTYLYACWCSCVCIVHRGQRSASSIVLHESQLVFGDRIFHMCVSIGITTEVRYLRRDQWGKNLNGVIS